MEKPHKFLALDALRGVAALIVVEFHFPEFFLNVSAQHGYLAVDFFFMLSGFVLMFAYQKKIDSGLPALSFLKIRIARLYPLYLLGTVSGFVMIAVSDWQKRTALPGHPYLLLPLGLLLLPALPVWGTAGLWTFPYNNPMWSLFMELVANAFHACCLRRRRWTTLLGVVVISGLGLTWVSVRYGTINFGAFRNGTLFAVLRVLFAYTAGMLLFLVWKSGKVRWRLPVPVLGLLLLGVLSVPTRGAFTPAFDLLVTGVFFPVLLLTGASSVPSAPLLGVCQRLGAISYGVYVLHFPLLMLIQVVWFHFRGHGMGHGPWSGIGYLVVLAGLATYVDRAFDAPVRDFLKGKLVRAED